MYLGTNERTEETFIGIEYGVVKRRSMNRLPPEDKWSREGVLQMKGTTWKHVPGVDGQHVPVDIDETGAVQKDEDSGMHYAPIDDETPTEVQNKTTYDRLHRSKKAIQKFGPTEGCPACKIIGRYGQVTGRIGQHHSHACRARIIDLMKEDPEYRQLMQTHERKQGDDQAEAVMQEGAREFRNQARIFFHNMKQEVIQEQGNVSKQLDVVMMQMLINKMEVAEVCSPPRVTDIAHKMGLKAGWSLDIITVDQDGRSWDFNEVEMRNRAVRKLLRDEPLLLIGSPMCTAFSVMNNLNCPKMCPEEVKRRIEYGRRHVEFCAKFYAMQWRAGRYFLHEHPEGTSSWQETCIVKLLKKEGVIKVNGDQCMYGLRSRDGDHEGPARKGIGFMTNSICIAQKLNKRCPNRRGHQVHRHVILENGNRGTLQATPFNKKLHALAGHP